MKKIKVKTIYLIAIVVGGLIGLATKSTYALFTSSTEIDNPICMATNLTSEEEVVDTMDVAVASTEVKEVPITINNTSGSPLNYMVFYNPISSDIEIGVNMKNADSSNSLGTINANETKKVYVQIKNNSTSSITITIGVVSNSISSDMNVVPIGKEGESAISTGKNLAEYITNLYTSASKSTVTNNSVIYNYATSVGLMNDRLGSSSADIDGGNIRYYGANPNNYIYFNCDDYSNKTSSTCEVWRIIGVFDGKVKIMRGSQIGTYSWDNKNTSTGADSSYGKNDWTTARLMKLLNPSDYYEVDSNDNGNGQSLYWNSQSGRCFADENNATKACNFTSTGIKNDTTRNMISETTYSLLGWNDNQVYSGQIYEYERTKGSVYSGRPTSWKGKIALAYLSDYGYAADFGQCTTNLYGYNNSTCISNNWMKSIITNNDGTVGWLLTPNSVSSFSTWLVHSSGYAYVSYNAYIAFGVVPVLYLNSELGIRSGDGSSSNPYQLSI